MTPGTINRAAEGSSSPNLAAGPSLLVAAHTLAAIVDCLADQIPPATIQQYRVLFDNADESHQFDFLVKIAEHLTARLSEDRLDAVARCGSLLSLWFLAPL